MDLHIKFLRCERGDSEGTLQPFVVLRKSYGDSSGPSSPRIGSMQRRVSQGGFQPGCEEVLSGLTGLLNPIFSRKGVVIMEAAMRMLAQRVDELTATLVAVRAQVEEVREAEGLAEATEIADEIIAVINAVIGPEDADEDSDEEESEEEPEDESEAESGEEE